jgi:hypothetical protein
MSTDDLEVSVIARELMQIRGQHGAVREATDRALAELDRVALSPPGAGAWC